MSRVVDRPSLEQVLEFCEREPVERVFLEDVARRGLGRFVATVDGSRIEALCHVGANLVPSGPGVARLAKAAGLEVHAGHGLDFATAEAVAALPQIVELNIGHYLIGEAVFCGLADAVRTMRAAMDRGRTRK